MRGTTTTINVSKTATVVRAGGAVSPSHAGKTMNVTLYRETGGAFQALATKHPVLNSLSTYSIGFARPNPGTCRIRAVFPGDSDHLGSLAAKNFSC